MRRYLLCFWAFASLLASPPLPLRGEALANTSKEAALNHFISSKKTLLLLVSCGSAYYVGLFMFYGFTGGVAYLALSRGAYVRGQKIRANKTGQYLGNGTYMISKVFHEYRYDYPPQLQTIGKIVLKRLGNCLFFSVVAAPLLVYFTRFIFPFYNALFAASFQVGEAAWRSFLGCLVGVYAVACAFFLSYTDGPLFRTAPLVGLRITGTYTKKHKQEETDYTGAKINVSTYTATTPENETFFDENNLWENFSSKLFAEGLAALYAALFILFIC